MIDMPNCEDCIHDEVCKIQKELLSYRDGLMESMKEKEVPNGISINMNCNYFSKFNQYEFERSGISV